MPPLTATEAGAKGGRSMTRRSSRRPETPHHLIGSAAANVSLASNREVEVESAAMAPLVRRLSEQT